MMMMRMCSLMLTGLIRLRYTDHMINTCGEASHLPELEIRIRDWSAIH